MFPKLCLSRRCPVDNLFESCAETADLAYINVDGDNDVLCSVGHTEEFFVFEPLYESDIVGFGVKKAITLHLDPTEGIFDEVPMSVELEGEGTIDLVGKVEFLRVVNYLDTRHSILG